jgi:hypothetical protein
MLELIRPAVRAAIVFLVHTALAMVSALGLGAFERLWGIIFSENEPTVAGLFPMRYIFEIGEACIFGVFVVFGIRAAVEAFRSRRPNPKPPPDLE